MCGCGANASYHPPHELTSPDPADLRSAILQARSSAGRGPVVVPDARPLVAEQTQEVPWMFARTSRREGLGQVETLDGEHTEVPRFIDDMRNRVTMTPWADTPATVIRKAPSADDGLGAGATCR